MLTLIFSGFFAAILGGFLNRVRGQHGLSRWLRFTGLGAGYVFITGGDPVAAALVVVAFLPGWPKWENLVAMSLAGLGKTTPVVGWLFLQAQELEVLLLILPGALLGPVYWACRKAFDNSLILGLHWVEAAEIGFGIIFGLTVWGATIWSI